MRLKYDKIIDMSMVAILISYFAYRLFEGLISLLCFDSNEIGDAIISGYITIQKPAELNLFLTHVLVRMLKGSNIKKIYFF